MELTRFQRWFPQIALRREQARTQILATQALSQRYYKSAQPSTYRQPVGADVSPQGVMQDGGQRTRQYTRNLDENNDIAISILDTLVGKVIGTGLPIQPLIKNTDGTLNYDANERMARILAEWGKKPTADRQESFAGAQRLLCRTWLRDGEVLINKLMGTGTVNHVGPIPYTLEMIEPDYLPYQFNESDPRLIIQGVQVTRYYEPTAYWLARVHPGDIWNSAPQVFTNESDYRRIDADQIIHLKFTRRINQVRGISILHGVVRRLEQIETYTESEAIAAQVASAFTGYIKKSPDAQTVINQETGERDLEMSPGMIFSDLLPGEEIGTIASNRPNTEINEFSNGLFRRISAGTMVNYSTVTRDYDGSYSSQRQGMVDAQPNYNILRDYFAERAIVPIYRDLVDLALATQELILAAGVDLDTVYDMKVADVPMVYVDPKKEVEADLLRIDGGLTSRSAVISERNGDPMTVAKQRENDKILFENDEVEANDPQAEAIAPEEDETGSEESQPASADAQD
jgi:lambda family phage portal protein